jgi:hypothetical protein
LKNNKTPIKVTDSVLFGYFRKETVNNFRDAFKNNHTLPNEFSTLMLKSRTRTETKVLKKEATIREVFGEDRPASAPPMQNRDDTSQDDDSQNETPESTLGKVRTLKQKVASRLRNAGILRSHKAIVNSKRRLLTAARRRKDLLKSLADKKLHRIKTEMERGETNDAREEENNEMEDDKNDPETRNKKKLKLRPGRRKFRSGFDYIRKKKKPLKRDEALPKERKRVRTQFLIYFISIVRLNFLKLFASAIIFMIFFFFFNAILSCSKIRLASRVRNAWPTYNPKSGRGLSRRASGKLYYTAPLASVTR